MPSSGFLEHCMHLLCIQATPIHTMLRQREVVHRAVLDKLDDLVSRGVAF